MTQNLALVRLSAINPFLFELRRRGIDPVPLLRGAGFPDTVPASSELFVSSLAVYEFVERSAETAEDPFLGYRIGSALDLHQWEPIAKSVDEASTVVELLNRFVWHALEHSSATRYYIRNEGDYTLFGFVRVACPVLVPAQNDAFYYGFISRVLRRAVREHWNPAEVLFTVSGPDTIPRAGQVPRIATGDYSGIKVQFPTSWLFATINEQSFHRPLDPAESVLPPTTLLEAVRIALIPHLHDPELNVAKAAQICGYNPRRLSRELRQAGTTLRKEIATLRAERAKAELSGSSRQIAEIATSVGFPDPTVFSRAFRKWTNQSPQQYRRSSRQAR